MSAESLNCPMCGAAASTDSTRCDHCGARLATVACPSCFGMMFVGAKFCSHCGARADRVEAATDTPKPCPRCRDKMESVVVGNVNLLECPRCEGIWADALSMQQICADREKQSAVLGMPTALTSDGSNEAVETVRYIPCPMCSKLMNRVNFAHCSHVVVDVCHEHGTWFDKDELRRIVEFIRTGGMEKSRAIEMEELDRRRSEARMSPGTGAWDLGPMPSARPRYDLWDLGISAAATVLKGLIR